MHIHWRSLVWLALVSLALGCKQESDDMASPPDAQSPAETAIRTGEAAPAEPPRYAEPEPPPAADPYPASVPAAEPAADPSYSFAPRSAQRPASSQGSAVRSFAPQAAPLEYEAAPRAFAPAEPLETAPPPESIAGDSSSPRPAHSPAAAATANDANPHAPPQPPPAYDVVSVFYATDRNALTEEVSLFDQSQRGWFAVLACALAAMALAGAAVLLKDSRLVLAAGAVLFAALACVIYRVNSDRAEFATPEILIGEAEQVVDYGGDRGELELGVCQVSIPPNHQVGQLEAPSIIRLEFQENPEKHVVLLSVERRQADEYFEQLASVVAASERKEALVFVHGFNVSFTDAIRRTAQISYDLRFEGAPICYSWPSQGNTWGYTIDETNVRWTVPHLKRFLLDVVERSGATSVNLVAHSMGNRALTAAVRELTLELRGDAALFNEIVLAAPDIDAEVFRRDIAPAMARAGKRVTLYASSNDQALAASRAVHGYPRAGESGDRLVVVPGVDTIDVSAIDTSLLGHSYYGDSSTLLYDMHTVIRYSLPPERRDLLRPMLLGTGLQYWVFQPPYAPIARPAMESLSR